MKMDINYHENGFNNSCFVYKDWNHSFPMLHENVHNYLYIYNIYIFTMSAGALFDEHIVTISIFL